MIYDGGPTDYGALGDSQKSPGLVEPSHHELTIRFPAATNAVRVHRNFKTQSDIGILEVLRFQTPTPEGTPDGDWFLQLPSPNRSRHQVKSRVRSSTRHKRVQNE